MARISRRRMKERAKSARWRAMNPEKARESCRRWYERNKDEQRKMCLAWYYKNHEKALLAGRKSRKKRRAKMRKLGLTLTGTVKLTKWERKRINKRNLSHCTPEMRSKGGKKSMRLWLKNSTPEQRRARAKNANIAAMKVSKQRALLRKLLGPNIKQFSQK